MKAVIDRAGRIVVPKPLRQALGLKPSQPLEIRAGDGRLEIEIASTPMQLKKRGKGLVAVPEAKLPPLTAEQVRAPSETIADLVGSVDGLAADLSGRRKGHLRTTGMAASVGDLQT